MPRELKNQGGGWLTIPWEEYVGRDSSHGATFSTGWDDGSQATFTILINWQDAMQAELEILGAAVFNSTTGNLERQPPVRHPQKPSYRAERIVSAQPMVWLEKEQQFTSSFITGSTGAPLSKYAYWLLVIGFHQPKYRVMSDSELLAKYGSWQEWQRYTEVKTQTGTTQISREGGLWQWADGDVAGPGPVVGDKLTAPVGVTIYTGEVSVIWRRIPRNGLFANSGEYDYFNKNILSCRNMVHNGATNLWGFQAAPPVGLEIMTSDPDTGPLRFLDAEATPIPSPFDPKIQKLTLTDHNEYYDVTLKFGVWQPPAGHSNKQGWGLGPAPNNRWYLIKSAVGSNTIFPTADLSAVFKLSSD